MGKRTLLGAFVMWCFLFAQAAGAQVPGTTAGIHREVEPRGLMIIRYLQGMLGMVEIEIAPDKIDFKENVYTVFVAPSPGLSKYGLDPEELEAKLNSFIEQTVKNIRIWGDDRIRKAVELHLRRYADRRLWEDIEYHIETEIKPALTAPLAELFGVSEDAFSEDPYSGILEAYVNLVKKGEQTRFIVWEIEKFKISIKESVGDYIKTYSGEEIDLINPLHAGVHSYFSEYAASLYLNDPEIPDEDTAVEIVKGYIQNRIALKDSIQQNIFKTRKINIFDPNESGIVSYFADLMMPEEKGGKGLSLDEVKGLVEQFGGKLDGQVKAVVEQALYELGYLEQGREENSAIIDKFKSMLVSRLLKKWEIDAVRSYIRPLSATERKDFYDRFNLVLREKVRLDYINQKGIDDFFAGDDYNSALDWIINPEEGFIKAMLDIKRLYEDKFGEGVVDLYEPEHEAIIMRDALRLKSLMDWPERNGYETALDAIAEDIKEMKENPFAEEEMAVNAIELPQPEVPAIEPASSNAPIVEPLDLDFLW